MQQSTPRLKDPLPSGSSRYAFLISFTAESDQRHVATSSSASTAKLPRRFHSYAGIPSGPGAESRTPREQPTPCPPWWCARTCCPEAAGCVPRWAPPRATTLTRHPGRYLACRIRVSSAGPACWRSGLGPWSPSCRASGLHGVGRCPDI
eukprot:2107615-Pyramimonas_sp.AAC.1